MLTNGKVLIVWEEPNDFSKHLGAAAELYDPDSGTFSQTGPMIVGDFNDGLPTATLLMNGRVLITGGADDTGVYTRAELFEPSTGTFADTGSMATPHSQHTATLLSDGAVLVVGGISGFGPNGPPPKTLSKLEGAGYTCKAPEMIPAAPQRPRPARPATKGRRAAAVPR